MPTVFKVKRPSSRGIVPAAANQGRENPNREIYGSSRWKRTSKNHLRAHPFCVHCEAAGKLTVATITDHIRSINQGGEPWDPENYNSLCLKCHQTKSAKERHQAKAQ
ncbi:HNH endonuclease [Spirosoma agri]|uniref:HNH endonuclease n=1 Tax=Spirosoma agri TaxID=1987381 RepID=A0A6M0IKH1_9BACT|nr:HNH endonuclease [Spirosoma agri]NEU68332.1 HNH endonuclease [Spirosoma agri]